MLDLVSISLSFSLASSLVLSLTPVGFHSFSPDMFVSPDVGLRAQIGCHGDRPNNRQKQRCEEENDGGESAIEREPR